MKIEFRDYCTYHTGKRFLGAPGEMKHSNYKWISLPKKYEYFSIPEDSDVKIDFTIKVPDDPNLEGSYYTMFLLQGEL